VLGTPSEEIVRQAQSLGAALIIVGLRRHGPIDRALNNETALRVMRHASSPVLGVVPGTTALPVRVLAAIDFSCVSMAAARAASELVGEKGALVLAYVPQLDALLADEGEKVVHELGMHEAFKRAARELEARRVACDHIVLHQEAQDTPAELLLEYADASRSDLIAAGSARHSRIQRWMIGSVSTELVRDGRRSVLIIPSRCAPRR
ncbi:MAG: universal stress protein, partial [Gemmatimonadaceae bacterium]